MRIRSIKPDFWRSEDITELAIEDRLLFVGLWSYVDDNGVGKDSESAIIGDLFAADMFKNPRETVARVSRGLSNLAEAGRIARYSTGKGDCIYVVNWERHQRIDKPNKPRLELPSLELQASGGDSRESREGVASSQRIPAPGAGEQGNRGAGEQGSSEPDGSGGKAAAPTTAPNETATTDGEASSQTLIAEWIDHCNERPPKQVIGQLSKQIKSLLDEGHPYEQVRTAVQTWNTKGTHPSVLPSVLHELRNKKAQPQQYASASERRLQAGAERLHRRAQKQAASLDQSLLSITDGKAIE